MFRYCMILAFATLVCGGCGSTHFTDLGNGVAVPSDTIGALAETNGLTDAQARAQLRAESEQRRVAEHAKTYGISLDESREQLEHARQSLGQAPQQSQ